jgi:hypothetical protein
MADVRKVKVLSVEFNREWAPPGKTFKVYYFNIKTEDGLSGEFSTSSRDQTKFLTGQEYEVKIETKTTGKGSYNFFDYSDGEKENRKSSSSGGGFKKGGNYIEDDSKHYQHITTALGYMLMKMTTERKQNYTVQL